MTSSALCYAVLRCAVIIIMLCCPVLCWVRCAPCRIRDLNDEINKLIREKVRQHGMQHVAHKHCGSLVMLIQSRATL